MVEVKGTLDELYFIFGEAAKKEAKKVAKRAGKKAVQKGSQKASAYSKKVGRLMKMLNKKGKTKAGKWKKGWSQKRVMKEAHRLAKK